MRNIAALFAALVFLGLAHPAMAGQPEVFSRDGKVAINGYDPVSYFAGTPMPGKAEYALTHKGVEWRFATAENMARFKVDPMAYEPQYGGYCAYGLSQGYAVKTEPDAWKIVDGRLYLNYDKGVQRRWEKDIPGYIAEANRNWPRVLR